MSSVPGKLKILLLGDYSGCHAVIARGLRELGHEVTVASAGSTFQSTSRDIDLRRPSDSKLGGLRLWLKARKLTARDFKGYDIVAINNPLCFDFKPQRNLDLLRKIRRQNRSFFLTSMGTDYAYIKECLDPLSELEYNEWRLREGPSPLARAYPEILAEWQSEAHKAAALNAYEESNGVLAVLYEYYVTALHRIGRGKTGYCGIPVMPLAKKPAIPDFGALKRPINIFLGRHSARKIEKGTDILADAATKVIMKLPKGRAKLTIVEDVSQQEYYRRMDEADVVLDQIYSHTPATNALAAMARGKAVLSGGEEDFYNFIGEKILRPIVNVSYRLEEIEEQLGRLISNLSEMSRMAEQGPLFVEKYHTPQVVAGKALDFWQRQMENQGL